MIDLTNQKWDFSKEENYAVNWFKNHGYNLRLEKQYINKTIFTIEKDGVSDKFELPLGKNLHMATYMAQFQKNWEILCELRKLQKRYTT